MTPNSIIAKTTYVVTSAVDRITGDRSDYPLLVAAAVQYALSKFTIQSNVFYGPAAWVEILENNSPIWVGCWGDHFHFWVGTEFGEIVDLNLSVSHRKRAHTNPEMHSMYSPPMVWAKELPRFYRYIPEGIAEIELTDERDTRWFELIKKEIDQHCQISETENEGDLQFPNEAILCGDRKILDDSKESFKQFDRSLGVYGIPEAPL